MSEILYDGSKNTLLRFPLFIQRKYSFRFDQRAANRRGAVRSGSWDAVMPEMCTDWGAVLEAE